MFFNDQIRKIPKQFSWIDQRLVQEGHIDRLSHGAMGLYLFLVTVGDVHGVSFYSDKTLKRRLRISQEALLAARQLLVKERLIAYQKPFYQVLGLPSGFPHAPAMGEAVARPEASKKIALQSLTKLVKKLRTEV